MNWYITKLIFSIDTEKENGKAQFDEQFRLVNAASESDAYFKAKGLGTSLQSKFLRENNEIVSWNFVDVSEVIHVTDITDGVEVYSNTCETHDKQNFINAVRLKAITIQSKSLFTC